MLERIKDEPALVAGLVQSLLVLLVVFGVSLTDTQVAAILGVTSALLAFLVRRKVVPQHRT